MKQISLPLTKVSILIITIVRLNLLSQTFMLVNPLNHAGVKMISIQHNCKYEHFD